MNVHTCTHKNPETPGGNKTESVFYKPFVQLLMPWPDCPRAAVLPQTHKLGLFAKPSALTACTVLFAVLLGGFFSAQILAVPLLRDREELIPFAQVMQKQSNVIQNLSWNP